MRRCLQLATGGLGTAYPNPLVGSVVVHKDTIIGEGWHRLAGTPHGEANAIASVGDRSLLESSTLYVNLEPCSHYGRTPPCANLILANKIPRVVIGCTDPNPQVLGRGITLLRGAGVEVITGILEDECREINRRFFVNFRQHRPYIILKWAESTDGYISPATKDEAVPVYLSGALSRQLVHKWRTEEDGILVGGGTIRDDDPKLDNRHWAGNAPVKIVLDRSGTAPRESRIFEQGKTIVFSQKAVQGVQENVIFETLDFEPGYPRHAMQRLFEMGICSVIVEGGRTVLQAFIDLGLWDEARVFKCPVALGEGTRAPMFGALPVSHRDVSSDRLFYYRNYDRHDNL